MPHLEHSARQRPASSGACEWRSRRCSRTESHRVRGVELLVPSSQHGSQTKTMDAIVPNIELYAEILAR